MPGALTRVYSLELMNDISSMPETFNEKGYFTMFAQSSSKNSIKMYDFSKNVLHIQESYGKEDMPRLMDYLFEFPFGYDYDLFDFTAKKVEKCWKKGQSFFVFSFTGSTHIEYMSVTEQFNKYPPDSSKNKYLNVLNYSDYSIGHLMDMAKQEGWFEDAIFIFIADHVASSVSAEDDISKKEGVENGFKIPFVIYAPKISKPQKIDYVVSQADLVPTIYHLMGIGKPFSALGSNALDKNVSHFALINDGADIIFVKNNDYIKHNRSMVTGTSLYRNSNEFKQM
ncbi:hypothetical protein AGMMS49593_05250 [Endomicrobiia bacterium]|nr:hypothetical protein AGMMS49593_05250 [Endomicrobiia bacterium]